MDTDSPVQAELMPDRGKVTLYDAPARGSDLPAFTRTLTGRQLNFLQVARECGPGTGIGALCAAAGVPKRTYYDWRAVPAFADAYDRLWYVQLKDAMPSITASLIDEAQHGNVKAQQLAYATMGLVINQSRSESVVRVVVERE